MDSNKYNEYDFCESLVIAYAFSKKHDEAFLILDYARKKLENRVAGDKLFIKLLFTKVFEYQRIDGTYKALTSLRNNFFAKDHTASIVTQKLLISHEDDGLYKVHIDFGHFGRVNFRCVNLILQERLGKAVQIDVSSWKYLDFFTEDEFDYYDPI